MKKFQIVSAGFMVTLLLLCAILAGGAEAKDVIKIGFMGNLASPASLSSKAAAQLAVDEMNTAGGILGHEVELIIEDTKGEIPKCVEIYKKLVMKDKVLAVVIAEKVEMGAAGMEIGAELFPEFPHIFFSTIGSGDVIWHRVRDDYNKYRFGFQTYYSISTNYLKIWAPLIAEMAKDNIKAKKIAQIFEDMEWTNPLRKGLEGVGPQLSQVYKQLGLEPVYQTTVSVDQKMFTSVFEEIAASGAQFIDAAVGYIDEAALVKQWAQSSAKDIPMHIWGGLAGMPAAWNITQGKCAGIMIGSSMVRVPITEKTIPFMDAMQKRFKMGAIFGSHTTYDTLAGFKKALVEAGTVTDVEAIIKKLESVEEVAVLGTIGWDPKLHYNLPYPKYITPTVQWQTIEGKGQMVVIFPPEYAQKPFISPVEARH